MLLYADEKHLLIKRRKKILWVKFSTQKSLDCILRKKNVFVHIFSNSLDGKTNNNNTTKAIHTTENMTWHKTTTEASLFRSFYLLFIFLLLSLCVYFSFRLYLFFYICFHCFLLIECNHIHYTIYQIRTSYKRGVVF